MRTRRSFVTHRFGILTALVSLVVAARFGTACDDDRALPKPKPCIPSSKVICPCEDAPEQPTCRGYNGDGSGGVAYPEKDTGGPEPDPDPTDAADDGADITDAGDASDV